MIDTIRNYITLRLFFFRAFSSGVISAGFFGVGDGVGLLVLAAALPAAFLAGAALGFGGSVFGFDSCWPAGEGISLMTGWGDKRVRAAEV